MKNVVWYFVVGLLSLSLFCMDERDINSSNNQPIKIKQDSRFEIAMEKGNLVETKKALDDITSQLLPLPGTSEITRFFNFCPIVLKKEYISNWLAAGCYDPKNLFDMIHETKLLSLKKQCFFRWIESKKYQRDYDLPSFFRYFKEQRYGIYYQGYENIKHETYNVLEKHYSIFFIESINPKQKLRYFIKIKQYNTALVYIKTFLGDLFDYHELIKKVIVVASHKDRIDILNRLFDMYSNVQHGLLEFIFNWHAVEEARQLWIKNIQDKNTIYGSYLIENLLNTCSFDQEYYINDLFRFFSKDDKQLLLQILVTSFLNYKDTIYIVKDQFDSFFEELLKQATTFKQKEDICNLMYLFTETLLNQNYRFKEQHIKILLDICQTQHETLFQKLQNITAYLPVLFIWYVNQKDYGHAVSLFEKIIEHPTHNERSAITKIIPAFLTLLHDDPFAEDKYTQLYKNSIFYDPLIFLSWVLKRKKVCFNNDVLSMLKDIYARYLENKRYVTQDHLALPETILKKMPLYLYQECLHLFCKMFKKIENITTFHQAIQFPSPAHETIFFSMLEHNLLDINLETLFALYLTEGKYKYAEQIWLIQKDKVSLDYIEKMITKTCKKGDVDATIFLLNLFSTNLQNDIVIFCIHTIFDTHDKEFVKNVFASWNCDTMEMQIETLICSINTALLQDDIKSLTIPAFKENDQLTKALFEHFCDKITWEKLKPSNMASVNNFLKKYLGKHWQKKMFYYLSTLGIYFKYVKHFYDICRLEEVLEKDTFFKRIQKQIKDKKTLDACNTTIIALKLGYIQTEDEIISCITDNPIALLDHFYFDRSLKLLHLFYKRNFHIRQMIHNNYFLDHFMPQQEFDCRLLFAKYGFISKKYNIDTLWKNITDKDISSATKILDYFKQHTIHNFKKWQVAFTPILTHEEKNTILMDQIHHIMVQKKYYKHAKMFECIFNLLSVLCDYSDYKGKWEKFFSKWIARIIEQLIYSEKGSQCENELREYLQCCLSKKTRIDISSALVEGKTVLYKLAQHGYFKEFDLLRNNVLSQSEFEQELIKPQRNRFQYTDGSVLAVIKDRIIGLQDRENLGTQEELYYWQAIIDQFDQTITSHLKKVPLVFCSDDQSACYV